MVKNRVDQYPLTHMDCVEKAISSMLGEFNENFSSIYLIYTNFIRCYKQDKKEKMTYEMGILESLCKEDIIPLAFTASTVTKDVFAVVENLIEQGQVCLVPGNLNELYYSKYYHVSDWPHLFYINGCRKDEQLFKIIDSVHKTENEQVFSKFVMEYEKLEKVYTSYCLTYPENMMYSQSNVIYSFKDNRIGTNEEVDMIKIVKTVLNELTQICIGINEVQMLNGIKQVYDRNSGIKEKYNENIKDYLGNVKIKFGRGIKRKEVLFSEILGNLEMVLQAQIYQELKSESEELIKSWNGYYRVMMANILRGDTATLEERLQNIIKREQDFILKLHKAASEYTVCTKSNIDENIWKVENNGLQEMSFDEQDIVFRIKEEHNAWIEDKSIKAILNQTLQNKENWKFKTHVCISGAYKCVNYHVGIVLRTSDDKMYFWGCYNNECIRLSNIGIKVDELDIPLRDEIMEFDLGVIKDDENIKLYYGTKNGEDKFAELPVLNSSVTEIGIVCKTWESEFEEEFVSRFSDINYNVSNM